MCHRVTEETVACGENQSLLSMGLMRLVNKKEVLIVGGNKQLVIFSWEEGKLVEFYREDMRNVVEICICDNWFVAKYRRKRAKLFRILPEDQEIEIDGSWDLKIKPYVSNYRTLLLQRFRKNQLIIADSSHKTKGVNMQLELFDVKKKRTVTLEDIDVEGKNKITGVLYTPKFQKLAIFDEDRFLKVFEFDMNGGLEDQTGAKMTTRRNFKSTGSICRVLMNKLHNYFIIGTTTGEIYFYRAETLEEEKDSLLDSKRNIVDITLSDIRGRTMVYILHRETKDFKKYMLEPVIGNLLMDRYNLLNPVYTAGKPANPRRKKHAPNQRGAERGNQDNTATDSVGLTSDTKRQIKSEMDRIEDLDDKILEYRRKNPTDKDVRHLEQDCVELEKEIEEIKLKEKERIELFKEERQQWVEKIEGLKKIKEEIENSQPQNNPRIKTKLREQKKRILKLIKKGRKAEGIPAKIKKMKKIQQIIDEILIEDPKD